MSAEKQARGIPERSGVYQIRCKRNGKIYIGSAVNLRARWEGHQRELRKGLHHNPYLQRAWTLYGAINFEFTVLELTDCKGLLEAEQRWIHDTGCTDRRIGFNVKLEATAPGEGIGRIWTGFRDPSGNPITIVNLSEFCRRNGLNSGAMLRLFRGNSKLKSCKGWTHVNSVRQREYIKTHEGFIDPGGRLMAPIRNLAEFCRNHALDPTHMVAVAKGRILSHRGWTHVQGRVRVPAKVHKGFIAPGGAVVRIANLSAFCRACGLTAVHMFEVKNGKRRSHKGWTWKHDADRAFG